MGYFFGRGDTTWCYISYLMFESSLTGNPVIQSPDRSSCVVFGQGCRVFLGDGRPPTWKMTESLFHGARKKKPSRTWVDFSHPLLFGNNGSWSTLAHVFFFWFTLSIESLDPPKKRGGLDFGVFFSGPQNDWRHELEGRKWAFLGPKLDMLHRGFLPRFALANDLWMGRPLPELRNSSPGHTSATSFGTGLSASHRATADQLVSTRAPKRIHQQFHFPAAGNTVNGADCRFWFLSPWNEEKTGEIRQSIGGLIWGARIQRKKRSKP